MTPPGKCLDFESLNLESFGRNRSRSAPGFKAVKRKTSNSICFGLVVSEVCKSFLKRQICRPLVRKQFEMNMHLM